MIPADCSTIPPNIRISWDYHYILLCKRPKCNIKPSLRSTGRVRISVKKRLLVRCLLSLCSLQLFGQSGNDLVQISYDTVVSYIEDRSCLILVDSNNEIRLFHTCYVLNSTGDTDCKVNLRTNGLTGLSNLQILGLPAIIYNCTGAGYGTCLLYTSDAADE